MRIKQWFLIALREILNFLTNFIAPIISIVAFIAEVLPFIPTNWVRVIKKVEYWFFYAFGTLEKIEEEAKKELGE